MPDTNTAKPKLTPIGWLEACPDGEAHSVRVGEIEFTRDRRSTEGGDRFILTHKGKREYARATPFEPSEIATRVLEQQIGTETSVARSQVSDLVQAFVHEWGIDSETAMAKLTAEFERRGITILEGE